MDGDRVPLSKRDENSQRKAHNACQFVRLGGSYLVFDCIVAISRVQTGDVFGVKLRVGFEMQYEFPQPTPMIMVLGTHFTRASDIIVPDHLTTKPPVPITPYRDGFGNWCSRIMAPAGPMLLSANGIVRDSGQPDPVFASATQHAVENLPADTLVYLLGSRYCETDRLSDIAWQLFEKTPPGWARVQAICDFVHHHIAFGYEHACASKTASEASVGITRISPSRSAAV